MAYQPLALDQDNRIAAEDVCCTGCDADLRGKVPYGLCSDCGTPIVESLFGRAVCRFDSEGRIDEQAICQSCGYILRGLSPEESCPECSASIGNSLECYLLRYADRRWLGRIRDGFTWYLIATLLALVLSFGIGIVAIVLQDLAKTALAQIVVVVLAGLIQIPAVFMMTARDPAEELGSVKFGARELARIIVVPAVVLAVLVSIGAIRYPKLAAVIGFPSGIVSLILLAVVFLNARNMAMRIPDEKLASRTTMVVWFYVIATLIALTGGLLMGLALSKAGFVPGTTTTLPPITPTFVVGLLLGCVGGPVSLVFMVWSIVLLFKYRNRFAKASRLANALAAGDEPAAAVAT